MKSSWAACTADAFGFELEDDVVEDMAAEGGMDDMNVILDSFGEKLISLAKPVWKIQKEALEKQFLSNEL